MEVAMRRQTMSFKDYFLKEQRPFTKKRDVNWTMIKWVSGIVIVLMVAVILVLPNSEPEQSSFHEKSVASGNSATAGERADPTQETLRQIEDSRMNSQQVHSSLDYLYKQDRPAGAGGGTHVNRSAGMILSRNGFDGRTQLSPGTRIFIRLSQGVSISDQAVPVTGTVEKDVLSDSGLAIPQGSKAIGEASFESTSERTSLVWRSIILPDGRERPFSALGIGGDGQSGLQARVRSESIKNAIGQTLTKFVGAYAAGSINTGAFGANPGGSRNGLRTAIAETATERATAMGEALQKERKWAELHSGQVVNTVLNQPFTFRDPGSAYGQ